MANLLLYAEGNYIQGCEKSYPGTYSEEKKTVTLGKNSRASFIQTNIQLNRILLHKFKFFFIFIGKKFDGAKNKTKICPRFAQRQKVEMRKRTIWKLLKILPLESIKLLPTMLTASNIFWATGSWQNRSKKTRSNSLSPTYQYYLHALP